MTEAALSKGLTHECGLGPSSGSVTPCSASHASTTANTLKRLALSPAQVPLFLSWHLQSSITRLTFLFFSMCLQEKALSYSFLFSNITDCPLAGFSGPDRSAAQNPGGELDVTEATTAERQRAPRDAAQPAAVLPLPIYIKPTIQLSKCGTYIYGF